MSESQSRPFTSDRMELIALLVSINRLSPKRQRSTKKATTIISNTLPGHNNLPFMTIGIRNWRHLVKVRESFADLIFVYIFVIA